MTKLDERLTSAAPSVGQDGRADPDVLVQTFHALRNELISTLLYVLGNRDDALDAAQEAFVKCWGARQQLHQVQNLRAWIFRVAFNTAKDMQRSAWNRRAKPLQGEESLMMTNTPGPALAVELQESVDRLRKAILQLRDEEKEVFLLRQNGELTYEQIAELAAAPWAPSRRRCAYPLDKLRKILV